MLQTLTKRPVKIKKRGQRIDPKILLSLLFVVLLLVGAMAGIYLTQQRQDIRQQAYPGQICNINTDCDGADEICHPNTKRCVGGIVPGSCDCQPHMTCTSSDPSCGSCVRSYCYISPVTDICEQWCDPVCGSPNQSCGFYCLECTNASEVCGPTPSGPTITPFDIPTITPWSSPTPTPTGELTPTPTDELTPTPTDELTPTPTDELTPTPTEKLTPTATPPVWNTPTATPPVWFSPTPTQPPWVPTNTPPPWSSPTATLPPGFPTYTPAPWTVVVPTTIQCNSVCYSDAECAQIGLICYNGRCRLAANPEDQYCRLPGSEVIIEQPVVPQELPQSGPADWLRALKVGLTILGIGALLFLML